MKNKRSLKRTAYLLSAFFGMLAAYASPVLPELAGNTVFGAPGSMTDARPLAQQGIYARKPEKSSGAEAFSDVEKQSWYFEYVDYLAKNGVIKGRSQTEFAPNDTFNAAECATVITRYLGLEDTAEMLREKLISENIPGAELWYSGYLQALYECGVFVPEEFSADVSGGYVSVTDESGITRPLLRREFAKLITSSFDIDTSELSAGAVYREVCDNGNIYITGGSYSSTYTNYADEINDFAAIPEKYREYVLKAYYNGIFNGDENGNFSPEKNLSRAEMAKVISTVINSSLRERTEYRKLPEVMNTDGKTVLDGWGEQTLDRSAAYDIMKEYAENLLVREDGTVTYSPAQRAPESYFSEVYFYKKNGNVYELTDKCGITKDSIKTEKFSVDCDRVLFLLRNRTDAKVEGVLEAFIGEDGKITYSDRFKPIK